MSRSETHGRPCFGTGKILTFSCELNLVDPFKSFLQLGSYTSLKTSGHENIWERSRFIALRWVIDRYRVGFVRRRFSWILSRLKENVTKREKTDFSEEKYIKNRQNCSSQFRVSHFIWFLGQVWVLKWENGSKIKIKFNVRWTGIIKGQIQIEFTPRWQKVSRDYSTVTWFTKFQIFWWLIPEVCHNVTKTVTKMVTNNSLDRAREHHLSWPFKSVFPFFGVRKSEKRFLNSKKGNNCKIGNGLGYGEPRKTEETFFQDHYYYFNELWWPMFIRLGLFITRPFKRYVKYHINLYIGLLHNLCIGFVTYRMLYNRYILDLLINSFINVAIVSAWFHINIQTDFTVHTDRNIFGVNKEHQNLFFFNRHVCLLNK